MNEVGIFIEGNVKFETYGIDSGDIISQANRILECEKVDSVSISVIFTDNEQIQLINNDYRKRDYPTDVISFAYREEKFPGVEMDIEELGDVYISLEKTESQAKEFQVTFKEELLRLLIHGILHLIGYDHEISPEEEKRMQDREGAILDLFLQ